MSTWGYPRPPYGDTAGTGLGTSSDDTGTQGTQLLRLNQMRSIAAVDPWGATMPTQAVLRDGTPVRGSTCPFVEGALIADPVAQLVFAFYATRANPRSAYTTSR